MLGADFPDGIDITSDGVDVRIPGTRTSSSRLAYSVGTRRAWADPVVRDLYEPDAYLPAGEWTPIERIDCRPRKPDSGSTVGLTSVPADVVAEILSLVERSRGISKPAFNLLDLTPQEAQELAAILARVPGVRVAQPPKAVARVLYRAGLPTATFNVQSRRHVGLHVDIWDRMGWRNAWRGGNRISINLTPSPRYFIFVPIQVSRLAALLMRNNPALTDHNFNLAAEYLRRHPRALIYRLRVDPGEAYVAPTENIIHDGIPVATGVDGTLVIRGRFELTYE